MRLRASRSPISLGWQGGGIINTIQRPYECAFIMLPCSIPEVVFRMTQDREAKARLGRRRRKVLSMYFNIARSKTKVRCERYRRY